MAWQAFISSDPEILSGKPTLRGTRLSVEFVLDLFAKGWTRKQVIENYPAMTEEMLSAVFAFASEALHDEKIYFLKRDAA